MASLPNSDVEAILHRSPYLLYEEEHFIPVGQYLESSYRPDMDYVNGHLEVRNLGEVEHGRLQRALMEVFLLAAAEWRVEVIPECRVQIAPDRYRVPDLLVLSLDEPNPSRIITSPPLLCIEVLSQRDTFLRIGERVMDYTAMGVRDIWAFDPKDLGRVMVVRNGSSSWITERVLSVENTKIVVDLDVVAGRAGRPA